MKKNRTANALAAHMMGSLRKQQKSVRAMLAVIAEVDRRRLWAVRGHGSLLDYLRKDCGLGSEELSDMIEIMALAADPPQAGAP